jgi:hypothetical protein
MPDWHQYLEPWEHDALTFWNDRIAELQANRRKLMNRAKQRKHRANRDGR